MGSGNDHGPMAVGSPTYCNAFKLYQLFGLLTVFARLYKALRTYSTPNSTVVSPLGLKTGFLLANELLLTEVDSLKQTGYS